MLLDAVDSGASLGFLPPLETGDAGQYRNEVIHAIDSGNRILIAAFREADLVGSVHLDLAAQPNASHRAEVLKLFILNTAVGPTQNRVDLLPASSCNRISYHPNNELRSS